MTNKKYSLSIIIPALNEELSVKDTIESTLKSLNDFGVDGEIILVNDGSTDRTGEIAQNLAKKNQQIKVLHHTKPMGVGYSIREGTLLANKDAVTWIPSDGQNDPSEIIKYIPLLEYVDFIVPFFSNKNVRSKKRQFLSGIFTMIINITFGTSFNYTNGNVIYKRRVFDVIKQQSTGFFFQAECLIKSIRGGFTYAEVPILLRERLMGQSKAISFKSLKTMLLEYLQLVFDIYSKSRSKRKKIIS